MSSFACFVSSGAETLRDRRSPSSCVQIWYSFLPRTRKKAPKSKIAEIGSNVARAGGRACKAIYTSLLAQAPSGPGIFAFLYKGAGLLGLRGGGDFRHKGAGPWVLGCDFLLQFRGGSDSDQNLLARSQSPPDSSPWRPKAAPDLGSRLRAAARAPAPKIAGWWKVWWADLIFFVQKWVPFLTPRGTAAPDFFVPFCWFFVCALPVGPRVPPWGP